MPWPVFLSVCGTLVRFGLAVILSGRADERRWKRQREAEEGAGQTAE